MDKCDNETLEKDINDSASLPRTVAMDDSPEVCPSITAIGSVKGVGR